MSHHLLLNDFQANFRLHVSEDPQSVREKLDRAHAEATTVRVQTDVNASVDPEYVTVNPRQLGWWAVVRVPEPDET